MCIANGGGIRADLPAGDVTYGEVTTVLPFGNVIEVLEISGADLRETLAYAYDSVRPRPPPPHRASALCVSPCLLTVRFVYSAFATLLC